VSETWWKVEQGGNELETDYGRRRMVTAIICGQEEVWVWYSQDLFAF
jgi:hypothetical protein